VPALPAVGVIAVGADGQPHRGDFREASPHRLVRVQTPQAFRAGLLLDAYERAEVDGFGGTDTAACVERYEGVPVQVVDGDPRNIKVTYADDLFTAELILTASGYEL
jgi:2-C-methyl-D-erythritol 4-phosphate cytidylyltransferase